MRYTPEQVARLMRDHTFIHTGLWQDKDDADVRYSMRCADGGGETWECEIDRIEYHPMTEGRIEQICKTIDKSIACYAQVSEPVSHRLPIAPPTVRITKAAAKQLVKDTAKRALHIYLEDAGAEYSYIVEVSDEGWRPTDTAIDFSV